MIGASKGAELALLTASLFPELVGPVVAYTPSGIVWQGISFTPGATSSSWTYRGAPIPFLPFPAVAPAFSPAGMSMLPVCEAGLNNASQAEQAAIAVENATGPLLLVSGGADRVWNTGRMSRMIVDRMSRHGRSNDVRHLHFPDAGHMLFPYALPSDTKPSPFQMDVGGTPEANVAAHAEAWPIVVEHLLGRRGAHV